MALNDPIINKIVVPLRKEQEKVVDPFQEEINKLGQILKKAQGVASYQEWIKKLKNANKDISNNEKFITQLCVVFYQDIKVHLEIYHPL